MEDNRSTVAVIPCDDYDEEKVYISVKRGIDALGGIDRFVRPDEKILVKPNLLSAATPEKALTTHPAVLKAVFRILKESGCSDVITGDSPGHGSCEGAFKTMGLTENDIYGARFTPMNEEVHVDFEDGIACREFYFCKEIVESDAIINVCKMKTHALERITGAVKNVYGFICGYRKAQGHVKFPNDTVFARMLADIHRYTKPRLHIMDGITAMEGNGPAAGTPIDMKVILLSDDPVALDTVYCYLVDLDPELIPTNSQGMRMGIGTDEEDKIDIFLCEGDKDRKVTKDELFKLYGNGSFDVSRSRPPKSFLNKYSGIMTRLSRRPVIDRNLCVKCGICVDHCPVPGKAVDFKNGKNKPPVYDYSKCIRCYCCQEMCPRHAIKPGRGFFMNKKGSASITILVIIIVLLAIAIGGMIYINTRKADTGTVKTENPAPVTQTSDETAAQTEGDTSSGEDIEEASSENTDTPDKEAESEKTVAEASDEDTTDTTAASDSAEEGSGDVQKRIEAVTSATGLSARTVPAGHNDMRGLNATELVAELKCGWNLGNSLDSQGSETNWGNPATTKEMIDAIAAKGFNTIRIPVSWGQYTEKQGDVYVIKQSFLERVGDVVDYAIDNDMYVILNTHHETGWLIPTDKMMGDSADKFAYIWTQIALYFNDYGDHLIFEGLNEPRDEGGEKEWEGGTAENRRIISELEDSFVETVRATGGNNEKRLLLITSEAACFMDSALKDVHVPDDPYVGVSIHAYTPYDFTFSHDGDYDTWDGSHKSDIVWTFGQINKYFLSKGVPVVMTEFGAERKGTSKDNNDDEVVKWMKDYMSLASKYKVPVVIWDNNLVDGNGERFGLFNRRSLKWDREEVVDALIEGYKPE